MATEEISKLDGVTGMEVDLVAGENSRVSVSSTTELRVAAVADAVDEAGYDLVEVSQ